LLLPQIGDGDAMEAGFQLFSERRHGRKIVENWDVPSPTMFTMPAIDIG
jgi:hypothetical protein